MTPTHLSRRACLLGLLPAAMALARPTLACTVPPQDLTTHHSHLVEQTQVIVLARVIGGTDQATFDTLGTTPFQGLSRGRLAEFETVEVLRGAAPDRFSLSTGTLADIDYDTNGDFNGHRDAVFWDKRTTRQWNGPDCAMHPSFILGRTYLLFVDHPHWRAYEEIREPDDLWLTAVRRLIADPSLVSGLSLDLRDWLAMAHGVFVGRLRSCDGPTLTVEQVLTGSFDDRWRYSNEPNDRLWPVGPCKPGRRYLVIAYRDQPEILPRFSATVMPVLDGLVDFGPAMTDSDVDIQAFRIQSLDAVTGLFD